MTRYLSEEEVQILKHEFEQYDADKGGNITVEEFGRVMKKSGQNPTEEELAQIIKEVDLDGDGTINFDEFIAMMTGRSRAPPPPAVSEKPLPEKPMPEKPVPAVPAEVPRIAVTAASLNGAPSDATDAEPAEWKAAWEEFDPSCQGSITASQFRQVVHLLGESVTDNEVEEIINSVDGEDKISYKEFVEFAKRKQVDDVLDGY